MQRHSIRCFAPNKLNSPVSVVPSVVSGAVVAGFLGIAAADSQYKISGKVVLSAFQGAYAKSNEIDIDKQIDQASHL